MDSVFWACQGWDEVWLIVLLDFNLPEQVILYI